MNLEGCLIVFPQEKKNIGEEISLCQHCILAIHRNYQWKFNIGSFDHLITPGIYWFIICAFVLNMKQNLKCMFNTVIDYIKTLGMVLLYNGIEA